MFRKSVSTLLITVQSFMFVGLFVASAVIAGEGLVEYLTADRIETSAETSRALFHAMVLQRAPIAGIQTALLIEEDPRPTVEALRKDAADAVDTAMATLAGSSVADRDTLMSGIEASLATVRRSGAAVDAQMAKPLADRSIEPTRAWGDDVKAAVRTIHAADVAVSDSVRLVDPVIGDLLVLRDTAWAIRDDYGSQCGLLRGNIATDEPISDAMRTKWLILKGKYASWLQSAATIANRGAVDPALVAAVQTMADDVTGAQKRIDGLIEKLDASGTPQLDSRQFTALCNGPYTTILAVADLALDDAVAGGAERKQAALLRLVAGVIAVCTGVAASMFGIAAIRRRVSGPIRGILAAVARLHDRDFQTPVPPLPYPDELGVVAAELEKLRLAALEAERLEADATANREAAVRRASRVHELCEAFDAHAAAALAAIGTASHDLGETSASMRQLASSSSSEAGAVSRAAEETAQSVQTVAAATEELSASIREISQQLAHGTELTQAAASEARTTNATVEALSLAAQRIGDVTGIISEIASHTNLLALNATIEAARAGDAGKGFAVVASEVKSLAGQTAAATSEVSAQVVEIQKATADAVAAIRGITDTIAKVCETSSAISAAVQQQGAATQDISHNVQEVARSTQSANTALTSLARSNEETGRAAGDVRTAVTQLVSQQKDLHTSIDSFLKDVEAA